jgi:hypothetical protein
LKAANRAGGISWRAYLSLCFSILVDMARRFEEFEDKAKRQPIDVSNPVADERTAATTWRAAARPPRNPIREESAAAQTSPADEPRSTAEQRPDQLINGMFASEDRRI